MNKEKLIHEIESCNSKQDVLFLGGYVAKNPALINVIFELMQNEEDKKHWKAAWVLDHVFIEEPALLFPFIDKLIIVFTQCQSDSTKRIAGKLLSCFDIVDRVNGLFINICFDLLVSETVPVAIKVHAMQLIFNISKKHPEIKSELKLVLEEHLCNNTAAFKSRAQKLLKKL